jgi:hypothetical protein
MEDLSRQRLEARLGQIRKSPRDAGQIVLVVRRPAVGVRELPGAVMLDPVAGLAGDNWLARGSTSTPDGSADPWRQVTVMNARVAELVAGGEGPDAPGGRPALHRPRSQRGQSSGGQPARGRPGRVAGQRRAARTGTICAGLVGKAIMARLQDL